MSNAVEFIDELPVSARDPMFIYSALHKFADTLREHKGQWALHPTQSPTGTTNSLRAWHINSGKSVTLPQDSFEAAVRQGKLYVRALPRKRRVG